MSISSRFCIDFGIFTAVCGFCLGVSDLLGQQEAETRWFPSGKQPLLFPFLERGRDIVTMPKKPIIKGGINSFVKTALDNQL